MIKIFLNDNKIYETASTLKAITKLRQLRKKYHKTFISYECDDAEQNNFIFKNI